MDPMSDDADYDDGLADGLKICVDLIRGGACVDEIAQAVGSEPADRDSYQAYLRELRQILSADGSAFGGEHEQPD